MTRSSYSSCGNCYGPDSRETAPLLMVRQLRHRRSSCAYAHAQGITIPVTPAPSITAWPALNECSNNCRNCRNFFGSFLGDSKRVRIEREIALVRRVLRLYEGWC
jgi:hypothetical protein